MRCPLHLSQTLQAGAVERLPHRAPNTHVNVGQKASWRLNAGTGDYLMLHDIPIRTYLSRSVLTCPARKRATSSFEDSGAQYGM